jgi:hypothetical protein
MAKYPHWMYNIETGEGTLFQDTEDYVADKWADTPALCNKVEDTEIVDEVDRDALKLEAGALGLEFPSNVKTDKLIAMIAEAKGN